MSAAWRTREEDAVSAECLLLQGEAALAEEAFALALPLLHKAERLGAEPDRCAGNRWLVHMLRGEFLPAWRESDAIRRRGAPDPHRFWQGEGLRGKRVILRSLHGFGDAVQMFRFLPRLQTQAAHLIVEVPPRLVELAPCFDGMGEVITWGEGAPAVPPAWDVQIEVMELPYLLRVSAEDLEPKQGYVRLPARVRTEITDRVITNGVITDGGGATNREARCKPRVGVVWTAGHWNPSRSCPPDLLQGLLEVEGIAFWNLQGDREHLASASLLGSFSGDVADWGDGIVRLAAVIQAMDLVITVDTLAAHLAGALGVPCWVLLQHRADWRWMAGRADSPWYPSLQLWRQPGPGDWTGLLSRVTVELRHWGREHKGKGNAHLR